MKGFVLSTVKNHLLKTICVCVYAGLSGRVQVHACGGQRTILSFCLWLPSCLRQGIFVVHFCTCQTNWPINFQGFSPPSHWRIGKITDVYYCVQFYMGSSDLNTGPHACVIMSFIYRTSSPALGTVIYYYITNSLSSIVASNCLIRNLQCEQGKYVELFLFQAAPARVAGLGLEDALPEVASSPGW